MEQNPEKNNPIDPNLKLKDLYKYIQDRESNQIIQDISNPKRKKIMNQYNQNRKIKNAETKSRYNNSLDRKIVYLNNNNMDSDNDYSENIENKNIFTRIKPNLNNEYDTKTNYNYKRSLKNRNAIYKRSRTPDRKYTFYKKKKKRDSTDNTYSISYFTESNIPNYNSNYENNIYDSLDENNKVKKPIDYEKKVNKLIKCGLKFELNNEANNYIDLLTIGDIKALDNKINLQRLSKMKNRINNSNIYIKKNHTKGAINFNKDKNKQQNNNIESRNKLSKIINEDLDNKSYDCITFKKKVGMNKRRRIRNGNRNNAKSTDNYYNKLRRDKGTPIKKENDIGGKIVLYPKSFFKNKSNNENVNLINMNKKYFTAAILIQHWWKKNHLNFIKKICLIQRAFRDYLNRKNNGKILKKKTTLKTIYKNNNKEENNISNDLNNNNKNDIDKDNNNERNKNINEDAVILIQKKFRTFLFNKMIKEKQLENSINYIPKEICEMTKTRKRIILQKRPPINNKGQNINNKNNIKTYPKNNNNNIRTIRNGNNNKKENLDNKLNDKNQRQNKPAGNKIIQLGKKHHYTRSKLALSPLNKIFISPDTVRYDTDRYTFLKKCYFRNREEDKVQNEINKASTTEFMRKIDLKLKGIYLTPDKRHNPIVNPLLQIDNLGNEANIQLLSYSQEKNNNNNQNGARYKNNSNNKRQLFSNNNNKDNQNEIKTQKFKDNSNKIEPVNSDYYKNRDKKEDNKEDINNDKEENSNEEGDNFGGSINVLDVKSDGESGSIKIEEKVETINIPKEYIAKCKMGEIIINKNKDENESNNKEEEIKEKEEDENKRITKIILIQRNIKIFLEKIKPKITKIKKTILINKVDEKNIDKNNNDNDINKEKPNNKNNKLMQNVDNIEYLNDNKPKENSKKEEFGQTFNNDEPNNNIIDEKKEDIISENSSEHGDLNENFGKPKQIKAETVLKININGDKMTNPLNGNDENEFIKNIPSKQTETISNKNNNNLKDEMKYVNKIPGKANNVINKPTNNQDTLYINKAPGKTNTLINKINNNTENEEMKYINKIPGKNTSIYSKNKLDNEEMKYINKLPSKVHTLIKNLDNSAENEEMKYINKIPGKTANSTTYIKGEKNKDEMKFINKIPSKAVNLNKNIISNEEVKINIQENEEENSSSSVHIDDIRGSCPLKEIKKIKYKKYNKDYLENLLKDNSFKFTINQLKEIGMHYKYFRFDYIVKMFVQKIQKVNRQFAFHKIKGEGFTKHKNMYYDVIKTYLNNKDLYINDNNDVSKLLKDILPFYSNMYNKYKFIRYIKSTDEDKLVNTQLFRHDENSNNLISFICNYLKLEKKTSNFTEDLIKYHLHKNPIKNFNIFGLTRYINSLYFVILYSKVDIKELKNKDNLNLSYININNDNKEEEINDNNIENNIEINLSSDLQNKKYVRKTINYKKENKLSMKRHVKKMSSCDINNNSYENLPLTNDSLIKKSIIK